MLRRYRAWLIGPMFAGLVISVVVAFMWPDTYISSAVMRITPPTISDRLVPGVVNMQMQQRLEQMRQQILSRGSLSDLITRPSLDLYRKERAKLPLEDVIQQMRTKAIRIQMADVPTANGQGRVASAFTISFSYTDRFKAQAVVRELVSKFMEENNAVLRQQTDTTSNFINENLKSAKERLDGLESQIAEFKARNMGRLPEQFQSNVAQLQSLQMQLGNTNEALSRLQQQKLQLQTQLQNATNQMNYYQSMIDEQVQVGGNSQSVRNSKLDQLNQRIMDAQANLAAAREIYTPNHPQIKKIQAQLASLQKQFDDEQKRDMQVQATAAAANTPQIQRRTNPQMAKMAQDFQNSINIIKTDIQNTNLEMDEKLKQVQLLNSTIANLNGRIDSSPQLEQEYTSLMSEYNMAKQNYEDTQRKQELTDTAKSLEEHKAGENLEVLDPPSDPTTPSEPNRLQIAAIGTFLGLVVGVFLAGGREMKNTALKNLKDVRAYTNLPILTSVPLLENALLIRRKRRLQWLAWSSAIIIGSIAMSGSAYYYYFGHGS